MTQETKQTEWITPMEASLAMSMRYGYYISPDDIKQIRLHGKISDKYVKKASLRLSLYDRNYLLSEVKPPTKRKKVQQDWASITSQVVATWLESCADEIRRLEHEGVNIPYREEAQLIIEEREEKRKSSRSGRYSKTHTKTA